MNENKKHFKAIAIVLVAIILCGFTARNYIVSTQYSKAPLQAIEKTLSALNEAPKEILYTYESDDVVFAIYTDNSQISHCAKIVKSKPLFQKQAKYKFRESINITPTCFTFFNKVNDHLFYIVFDNDKTIKNIDTCGYDITNSAVVKTKDSKQIHIYHRYKGIKIE